MALRNVNVEQAAEIIGVSKDLVYDFCRQKKLPHFRMGARILIREEKLYEWMETQENEQMSKM